MKSFTFNENISKGGKKQIICNIQNALNNMQSEIPFQRNFSDTDVHTKPYMPMQRDFSFRFHLIFKYDEN